MQQRNSFSWRRKGLILVTLLLLVLLSAADMPMKRQQAVKQSLAVPHSSGLAIHVSGNQLVDGQGKAIRLVGVGFIGAKWCVQLHPSIFVQPVDAVHMAALASWHINVVRLTLNEDCWLGINGVASPVSGSNYRWAIVNFVRLAHDHGMYVDLALTWNAPGKNVSASQQPMADADHAPAFWQSVARTFKNDAAVLFEVYNEPDIASYNARDANPWSCWRDGGCTITRVIPCEHCPFAAVQWQAEGMQGLVNAVRSTGATNPILLGGLASANNLAQFLQYLPSDPLHQLVASFHNYQGGQEACDTQTCWDKVIARLAQHVPVVTTEFGENDCRTTFVNEYMAWADAHAVSYIAWTWMPWGCGSYGLIANWNGTPSAYGQAFYNRYYAISFRLSSRP